MSGNEQTVDTGVRDGPASHVACYDAVRVLVAVVLLTTAGLKGYQLATEPVRAAGLFESRWFLIGLVELELCFGLWLLSGSRPKLAWRAAVLCFGVFACVSAFKGVSGEASCGCFGRVSVNPWYTFALDLGLMGLLVAFPPARAPGRTWRIPAWVCVLAFAGVGLPGAVAMASFRPASVSPQGGIPEESRLVLLAPEEWLGKRFPLFDRIDVGDRLAEGKWLVVFYHVGCPECCELIERYRDSGTDGNERRTEASVALIEVPEPGQSPGKLDIGEDACVLGSLDDSREWFVSTPAIVALEDGTVSDVGEQGSAEAFLAMLAGYDRGP